MRAGRLSSPAAWPFALAVFTGAALIFLVEPLLGKMLLPRLGGSPAIWNTSLAFFQLALLAGYVYAHGLARLRSLRLQMALHTGVLALAGALSLPLRIAPVLGPPWAGHPALWLTGALALSVGAPFAVLSATAPLLQAWFVKAAMDGETGRDKPGRAYTLYAASNLGSFLALAAYPIAVEPHLGLAVQARLWSLGYGLFAAAIAALALARLLCGEPAPATPETMAPPGPPGGEALGREATSGWRDRIAWTLLAAAPSSLLVGVTSHITADVASVPFLWTLPLALYLATFVLAFSGRARPPAAWLLMAQVVATPIALFLLDDPGVPWPEQIGVHLGAFFFTALVCHQTLAARRPPASELTVFYLCVSLGGVIGGGFNAFLAPVLFKEVLEYPAALVLACLARPRSRARWDVWEIAWLAAGFGWSIPLFVPHLRLPEDLANALSLTPAIMAGLLRRRTLAMTALLAVMALATESRGVGRFLVHERSFFGVVHIAQVRYPRWGAIRTLVNGTTLHGAQFLSPALRCRPTSYYAPGSAIWEVFATEQARSRALRIGAVGLGAGTVATYLRPADRLRFYEIDPLVARIAFDPARFSFVKGCARGEVALTLGDARLSLAREPAGLYDLLLVDAFSSDSVPTHLMTVEAIRLYLQRLRPDGVLLMHLSNRNLALVGPAAAAARAAGAATLEGEHWSARGAPSFVDAPQIVLLAARDPQTLARYRGRAQWKPSTPTGRVWTDDYTNVWGALIARLQGTF